jgi:hypothetical protein
MKTSKKKLNWYEKLVRACNRALEKYPHSMILLDMMSLKIIAHTTSKEKIIKAIAKASANTLFLGPISKKPFIGAVFA